MKKFSIFTILLLIALGLSAQAGPISRVPFTITKPGKYYLIANVTPTAKSPAAAAITIKASNVELDLGGFSVIENPAAPATTTGILVQSPSSEVRVRNGRVSGFATGIVGENDAHHLLLEEIEITSPTACASLVSKGTRVHGCGFILTTATGIGLSLSSAGGGPAHAVEGCNFYSTVPGVAASQQGLYVFGLAPAVVRDCQFIGWGQGVAGNNATAIANTIYMNCVTKFDAGVTTTAGFNQ